MNTNQNYFGKNNSQAVVFESLEGRELMSAAHHHAGRRHQAPVKPVIPVAPAPVISMPLSISQSGGTLEIDGSAGSDQINITQSGSVFNITNGTWKTSTAGTFTKLVVKGNGGNDSITLDASVIENADLYGGAGNDTILSGSGNDRIYAGGGNNVIRAGSGNDTIVTLGSVSDTITTGTGNDSFWLDDSQSEVITNLAAVKDSGNIHRVGTFLGGVSKDLAGQTFAEPKTTDASMVYKNFSTSPLFSDAGPAADDVRQGYLGDCYWVVSLSSVAKINPATIRQSVVELGDGTYAVQLIKNGVKSFVRVDGNLPIWSNGNVAYAGLGAQNSTWVAIMEKAFTFVRSGANPAVPSYKTIDNGGWMSESYDAMGLSSTNLWASSATDWTSQISAALASNKAITFGTVSNPGGNLIGGHAYLVDHLGTDVNGNATVTLRNPWGVDGAGNDGKDDGYVTMTIEQAFAGTVGSVIAMA